MTVPGTSSSSLTDRVMGQVRRDPKKAAVLGMLLAILVAVGVHEAARRGGPSSAEGAVTPGRHAGVGPAAGLGGPQGVARAGAAMRNAPDESDEDLPDLSKQAVNRDLFLVNPLHFPLEEKAKAVDPGAGGGEPRGQTRGGVADPPGSGQGPDPPEHDGGGRAHRHRQWAGAAGRGVDQRLPGGRDRLGGVAPSRSREPG